MAGLLGDLGSLFGAPSPSPHSGSGQSGLGQGGQGQDGPGGNQGSSGGAQQQDPPSPPSQAPAPSPQSSTPETQPQNSNTPSPAPSSIAPAPSTAQQSTPSTHQSHHTNAATTLLTTSSVVPTTTVSPTSPTSANPSFTSSTTTPLSSASSTPSSSGGSAFPQSAAVGVGVTLGLLVLFGLLGAALKTFYFDRDITSRPKLWPPSAWFKKDDHDNNDFLSAKGGKLTEENVFVTGTPETSGLPPLPPKDKVVDVEKMGGMHVGHAEVVEFRAERKLPTVVPILVGESITRGLGQGREEQGKNETSRENRNQRLARKPVGSAGDTAKETPWGPDAIVSPIEKERGVSTSPELKASSTSPTVGPVEQPRRTRGPDSRARQMDTRARGMDPRSRGPDPRSRPTDPRSRPMDPRMRRPEPTTSPTLSRNESSESLGREREVASFLDFPPPPPPPPQEGYRAYTPSRKKSELFLD